jgi:hypothetical protein
MPLKDTPALRKLVARAIAEEDEVDVRVLPGFMVGWLGETYGADETPRLPRERARQLARDGAVVLVADQP